MSRWTERRVVRCTAPLPTTPTLLPPGTPQGPPRDPPGPWASEGLCRPNKVTERPVAFSVILFWWGMRGRTINAVRQFSLQCSRRQQREAWLDINYRSLQQWCMLGFKESKDFLQTTTMLQFELLCKINKISCIFGEIISNPIWNLFYNI